LELGPVDSTLLEAAGYDAAMQELEVVFASGKTYRYIGVPRSVYTDLLAAESKGRYLHAKVIGVYDSYEVVRRR
jgi:hypothetical protein